MKTQYNVETTLVARLMSAFSGPLQVRTPQIKSAYWLPLLAVLALAMLTPNAYADGPVDLAAQVMIQAQSDNAALLASKFGIDPNSNLQFGSIIDQVGQSFAFSLQPGSTYLGKPITLNVMGSLDTRTQTWTVSSAGSLAGDQWAVTSSIKVSFGATSEVRYIASDSQLESNMLIPSISDILCNGVWYRNDGQKTFTTYGHAPCLGYYWGNPKFVWRFQMFSTVKTDRGASTWSSNGNSTDGAVSLSSAGLYPVGGGRGSFSTTIAPGQLGCISCGNSDSPPSD